MGDLNRAGWEVEFKVARSVARVYALEKANVPVRDGNNIRGERVDLFLIGRSEIIAYSGEAERRERGEDELWPGQEESVNVR